tara:strand:+ start:65 stop:718 length:654 start_codon:yes stop_codon:yes gene_type:complete
MLAGSLFSFSVNAEYIELDLKQSGDQLVTYESKSGLYFMDITETVGMSVDEVKAELGDGGLFSGWSIATLTQAAQFTNEAFQNIDISAISRSNYGKVSLTNEFSPVRNLQNMLGISKKEKYQPPVTQGFLYNDFFESGTPGSLSLSSWTKTGLTYGNFDIKNSTGSISEIDATSYGVFLVSSDFQSVIDASLPLNLLGGLSLLSLGAIRSRKKQMAQ